MNDLINGRDLLSTQHTDLCYDIACKDCSMCTEDGGCRVEEWIDKFPSADESQEWIPTCDRLPSDSDYYLVTLVDAFGDTEICVVWYAHEKDYSGETGWREITDSDFVTAWLPLPSAYKEADDNRDYERAVEQMEYDMLYEPTYNPEDGSM